jgi:L,D-transpeptidase ErfK/SrfK
MPTVPAGAPATQNCHNPGPMTFLQLIRRAAALGALCAALASCSLLGPPWATKKAPPKVVVPPPPPAEAAPVATFRSELGSEHDDIVGVLQLTTTSKEDTFSDIARRFDIGYEEMLRANPGVDPWLPGAGRTVVVPTRFILPNAPRVGVVINVPAMRLYYFPPHKKGEPQVVYTHPIGIGRVGWKTPEGVTTVTRKQKDPVWHPPVSIRKEHEENGDPVPAVVEAGPDNPLGRSALYLGWPSYLIHGTNKPYGVGLRSSHGCIRLYNEDIDPLWAKIPIGTPVRVVNQPFVFGWHDDQLYLQAYGVLEDDPRDWKNAQKKLLSKDLADRMQKELAARGEQLNWDTVSRLAHDPRGVPVEISRADATLEQALASARKVENRVPDGANWDGRVELATDEKQFRELAADSDPNAPTPAPAPPKKKPTG